jgi:hypothetical protein
MRANAKLWGDGQFTGAPAARRRESLPTKSLWSPALKCQFRHDRGY